MTDRRPLKGDPLTGSQAQWLTTIYATQVRLQAERVLASGRARSEVFAEAATVTLAPRADPIWEAELGLLLSALVSFKKTLVVIAQSRFENAAILEAIYAEFDAAVPNLADLRNSMAHGEDWIRGQGTTKHSDGRHLGTSTLLPGLSNPDRDLCVVRFNHAGADGPRLFYPDEALMATERAIAALAGQRSPGDPDERVTEEHGRP